MENILIAKKLETYAKRAYNALVRLGGRPTHQIREPLPPHLKRYSEDESSDIVTHWFKDRLFADELNRWQKFRAFQKIVRHDPEWFPTYAEIVRDYRRKGGMEGDIHLNLQPEQQSKLDEWKEFQYLKHRLNDEFVSHNVRRFKDAKLNLQKSREESVQGGWTEEVFMPHIMPHYHAISQARSRMEDVLIELDWIDDQLQDIAAELNGEPHRERPMREKRYFPPRGPYPLKPLDEEERIDQQTCKICGRFRWYDLEHTDPRELNDPDNLPGPLNCDFCDEPFPILRGPGAEPLAVTGDEKDIYGRRLDYTRIYG